MSFKNGGNYNKKNKGNNKPSIFMTVKEFKNHKKNYHKEKPKTREEILGLAKDKSSINNLNKKNDKNDKNDKDDNINNDNESNNVNNANNDIENPLQNSGNLSNMIENDKIKEENNIVKQNNLESSDLINEELKEEDDEDDVIKDNDNINKDKDNINKDNVIDTSSDNNHRNDNDLSLNESNLTDDYIIKEDKENYFLSDFLISPHMKIDLIKECKLKLEIMCLSNNQRYAIVKYIDNNNPYNVIYPLFPNRNEHNQKNHKKFKDFCLKQIINMNIIDLDIIQYKVNRKDERISKSLISNNEEDLELNQNYNDFDCFIFFEMKDYNF